MKNTTLDTLTSNADHTREFARLFDKSVAIRKTVMALAIVGIVSSAPAANKFWAGPSGTGSAPTSGTWDAATVNWSTTSGGAATAAFATSDAPNFGGTDGVFIKCSTLTSGTITNNNSYTFTNDTAVTVSMAATTPWMIAPGKIVTIGTNVTFAFNTASGGTINVNNVAFGGTIIVDNGGILQQTSNQAFQFDGNGTLIRVLTGGVFQHTGSGSNFRLAASAGNSATLSIEGGTAKITGAAGCLISASATSIATVNLLSGLLNVTNNPLTLGGNAASTCIATNNLNGGTELVRQIKTTGSSTISIFNFNGGTLKAGSSALASTFMTGLTTANVRNNASTIDNGGYSIGIGQALLHSTISGDNVTDGGLIFTGGGVTTNSGANTYNGPTVVSAGTLVTTTASTGAGDCSVSNNATLNVQVNTAGVSLTNSSLTLGTSGNDALTNVFALGANASTTVAAIRVNGTVNLNGVVTVNVSSSNVTGPNTYLLMSYGSISGSGSFTAGTLPVVSGFLGSITNDTTARQLKLVYVAAPQAVKWAVGDGNWDNTTLNWQLLAGSIATNYVEGSLSVFDDSATGSSPITVTLAANRSPSGITNNSTKDYIIAGSASIAGSGTIVKNGNSTLTIDNSGPNNLSAVTISGGALQLGNNDANGDLGSATVTDNGALIFNRTDSPTFANVISGGGSLVQNGSGALTLSAGNTHAGLSTVNSGLLVVGNSSALQNSTVSNNVVGGVSFASGITTATFGGLAGAGDISLLNAESSVVTLTAGGNNLASAYSGSLTDGGNLLKAGTNVLTLSGNSTLNNLQVTTSGSTLAITGGNSTMGSLQIVTDNGSVLVSGGNTTVTLDSRIAGANGIYNVSGGTMNLPKVVIGSAAAANTNNLMTVSGSGIVNQNQPGGAPPEALWIGGNNNGSGALLLKDGASWVNSSSAAGIVVIGGNGGTGQGSLTIQDAATFSYPNVVQVGATAGGVGMINLNGGTVSVNGFSRGAGTGTINANGGTINLLTANANVFINFSGTGGNNSVNLQSGGLKVDTAGNLATISNVLSGAGGLTAQGSSTLTLTASNTYTGPTVINNGILKLTGAGSINSSSSVSNGAAATLDVSTANAQLSIAGALTLNDATLVTTLATTNVIAGTFGTAGSANTIIITTLPAITSLPAMIPVIKYSTAAPGLVDGGNNLTALSVALPATANPVGYLTNNAANKSIDLVITGMDLLPNITTQPQPDSVYPGYKAHFSVTLALTNSAGLGYSWRKEGVPLSDNTTFSGTATSVLHVSNASAAEAVNYDVVVANISGSVTSSPALLTLLTPTNYTAAAVAAGPAALYMLDENTDPASGTAVAYDFAGDLDGIYGTAALNGFNGVVGPRPDDGFPYFAATNTAAGFQGFVANSHVTIPPLNLNTNTVTLAAWINPNSPPANSGIIFCRGGATTAGLSIMTAVDANNNRVLGYTWNNEAGTFNWNSQIAPPPNQWSYVALVVTPTNATVYIINTNGLLSSSQAYTHVNQSFSVNTLIGEDSNGGNRQFNGSIDGAVIYAKALSQVQLEAIYGAASGVSNFPPIIDVQPVSQTLYEQQNATFSTLTSGTQPLNYRWQYFDGANYFDVNNGGRISGATSPSLVISNLVQADAANFVFVADNLYGSVTSSVVTLTVNPVGPAENITNAVLLAAGQDWNTGSAWSDGLSASVSAPSKPGSVYYIVPGGGLRTPNVVSIAQFPGSPLDVIGDGVFNTTLPAVNIGALVLKGAGSSYQKLVLNGGEILSFTDANGAHIIGGTEVNVLANTPIAGLSSTGGRSITINARLTGGGSMEYIGWPNTTFQPTAVTALNIAGTNNTFNGAWSVDAGTLVGSTAGALGTNNITVSTNAALQTAYNINNVSGTLILNGRMNLTRNDTFLNVIVNGTTLPGGTYTYSQLASAYPNNFPATWTGQTGVESATTASGSITVIGTFTTASYPTNITFAVSGSTLSLSWPATHLGWILQSQTNSIAVGISTNWTDVPGTAAVTSTNMAVSPSIPTAFYRLRQP